MLAALACVWVAAMLLTPEHCNILSRCDWYSDIGIGIIGAPIILVALLLALILSAVAWWRKA
ncbi:hypothetical protein [Plastoroseomonas hellenica]|uniref:hypothetical protein n=1 Tax=Plastoroseomonas hellenica TaxID=2687306 RepID=UPI001BAA20F2|nr:hypothetical protein [Plastoroseomonas hellenica]MBR0641902.1 hypothetical protein [Plastoroseomonas hellenica]